MEFIKGLGDIDIVVDIIKTWCMCIYTYYICFKLINKKIEISVRNILFIILSITVISCVCKLADSWIASSYSIIFMFLLIAILFSFKTKNSIGYSLLVVSISLSINYIIFIITMFISFIFMVVFDIQNIYIGLVLILISYTIFIYMFCKIKRFRKGFIFLQKNMKNDYIDILMLNVSVIIIIGIIILSNYNQFINRLFGTGFFIFSIIMFITIQKSLQLYYKQKLQEREVEETK